MNYLISAPQNLLGHQKQGKSETLSQPRGPQETRLLNVTCAGCKSGQKKDIRQKKGRNMNKIHTSVNYMYQCRVTNYNQYAILTQNVTTGVAG
jgi:hypothetical protein